MIVDAARVTAPGIPATPVLARRIGFRDALAFGVPALLVLQINAVGQLYVSELALLAALPFLIYEARVTDGRRVPHLPIILGLIWLFVQVETDLYRGSTLVDYSRGWSKIAFTLTNFIALYLLLGASPRRFRLFAWGLVVGLLAQFYFRPDAYALLDPWKFGLAPPLTLAVVLLASRPRVYSLPLVAPALIVSMAIVNLAQGFRSLAAICFVASGFSFVSAYGHRRAHRLGVPSPVKTLVLCACCVVAALGFMKVYEHAAHDGLLGSAAQVKYEQQVSGLGLILGGRPEMIASLTAIRDSPIIGHGSWARDPKYVLLLNAELEKYGLRPYDFQSGSSTALSDLIPEHSHLLGAWVEAGFFGTLFWFWALGLAIAVLSRLYLLRDRMTPLVAYLGLLLVWDILFSPFGAERRLLIPYYLIVLLFTWDRLRGVVRRSRGASEPESEVAPPEPEWEREL